MTWRIPCYSPSLTFAGDIITFTSEKKTNGKRPLSLLSASLSPQLCSLVSVMLHQPSKHSWTIFSLTWSRNSGSRSTWTTWGFIPQMTLSYITSEHVMSSCIFENTAFLSRFPNACLIPSPWNTLAWSLDRALFTWTHSNCCTCSTHYGTFLFCSFFCSPLLLPSCWWPLPCCVSQAVPQELWACHQSRLLSLIYDIITLRPSGCVGLLFISFLLCALDKHTLCHSSLFSLDPAPLLPLDNNSSIAWSMRILVPYIKPNTWPSKLQLSLLGYFPGLYETATGDTNVPSRHSCAARLLF